MSLGWFQALLGSGLSVSYDLLRFSLNYRTTLHSYLTSAAYSDCASFRTGSNPIRVITSTTPDSNPTTTAIYMYADDPDDDLLAYKDTDSGELVIIDRDWNEVNRLLINGVTSFAQATCFDPVNRYFYSFLSSGTVHRTDINGTSLATFTCTFNDGHVFYDYINSRFLIARETGPSPIEVWMISGGAVVQESVKWFSGADGVCKDNIFDKLVLFDGTGASSATRIREQIFSDGQSGIVIYPGPITTGWNTEGIAVAPDGTYLMSDPSGFHSAIVNGNRFWWADGRALKGKFERSPSMTRFNRFSGGTISGQFDTQKITQFVGQKIYSPIYDTNGFTNTENASAWEFEFSEGGDADITFRGSNTAPTLSSKTQYDSSLPTYSGWGATTPSAEQVTPGTFRYKQAVFVVKEAAVDTTITVQDLIDTIAPKILILAFDDGSNYVYTDASSQIPKLINQADPANSFNQTSAANRFTHNEAGSYVDDISTTATELLQTVSLITSDQQGHWVFVHRREATTTLAVLVHVGTGGSNNNRLVLGHNASGGTPASGLIIEQWGSGGTVTNRSYVADTGIVHKRYDFGSRGSSYFIKIDGVEQVLTTDVGANNGNWYGDVTTPNIVQFGFKNAAGGRGRYRLMLYKDSELTASMDTLLNNYITQENLLA